MASLVLTDSSQLTSNSQHLDIYSSPMASLVLTDSSQLTSNSQHLDIYSSLMASLVMTDSSQLTSDSQHLGIYSSLMASLVLTDSSQLTSDSQHLGIYSSPMASLVLTDSSQLTSDSQHLDFIFRAGHPRSSLRRWMSLFLFVFPSVGHFLDRKTETRTRWKVSGTEGDPIVAANNWELIYTNSCVYTLEPITRHSFQLYHDRCKRTTCVTSLRGILQLQLYHDRCKRTTCVTSLRRILQLQAIPRSL
uniref:Uncharacterized protein n=1 Tax=Timema poppense TaxID=170557 RepID=A0A7R9DUA1_TIMPO|nr:unnamed protein product [Timema poppensis]